MICAVHCGELKIEFRSIDFLVLEAFFRNLRDVLSCLHLSVCNAFGPISLSRAATHGTPRVITTILGIVPCIGVTFTTACKVKWYLQTPECFRKDHFFCFCFVLFVVLYCSTANYESLTGIERSVKLSTHSCRIVCTDSLCRPGLVAQICEEPERKSTTLAR